MSDAEVKIDIPESSESVHTKESRIRRAEPNENEEDKVPTKIVKLEEINDLVSDDDEVIEDDEDYDEEEEDLELAEDTADDDINEDDVLESGESSIEDDDQNALTSMEECQTVIDALTQQANDEILKVEQKFNKLRKPNYQRRNKHIKKIDGFWATVFSHHSELKRVLTKDDIKCFQFLKTIELDDLDAPKSGFSIKFNFDPNPYFTNSCITKEYLLPWNESPSCCCTAISWKPGMDLTQQNSSSFFSWFCSQADASTDDIAEIIKEELWPNPLAFYHKGRVEDPDSLSDASEDEDCQLVYVTDESAAYISSEDEEEGSWDRKASGGKHGKGGKYQPSTTNQAYVIEDEDDFEDEEDDDEEDKVVEINSPPKNHSNPVDGALSDNEDTKLSFEEQNGSLETDEDVLGVGDEISTTGV